MIAHLVVFHFADDVPAGLGDTLAEGLRDLTRDMPYFVRYDCGPALGIRQGADFGVLAVLRSAADVIGYLDDPAHVAFVRDHMAPHLASRHAVQIEIADLLDPQSGK